MIMHNSFHGASLTPHSLRLTGIHVHTRIKNRLADLPPMGNPNVMRATTGTDQPPLLNLVMYAPAIHILFRIHVSTRNLSQQKLSPKPRLLMKNTFRFLMTNLTR